MSPAKEISFLIQVALPFVVLVFLKHRGFIIPVTIIVLALPWPAARRFLIARWQQLGELLGRIVSPVVLSVLYYGALTPLAWLRRLGRSDELQLQRPTSSTLRPVEEASLKAERFDDLW